MIYFIIGALLGMAVTVFAFALCNIAGRDKRENE